MKLKVFNLSCVAGLTLALCSGPVFAFRQQLATQASKSAEEEEIRAVVLRAQMMDWAKGGDKSEAEAKDKSDKEIAKQLNFKTFFISVEGKDPSAGLMLKLADVPRVLKPASACEIAKVVKMPVVDKKTRKRGIIFSVDKIRWSTENSVKVDGGYHCDGLCGAGITFSLERVNSKWTITKSAMNWIS